MKLVGIMLCKDEAWIIGCSMRAALRWVDHLILLNHDSTDGSSEIALEIEAKEYRNRVTFMYEPDTGQWDEMFVRQRTLEEARKVGATHVAIIDADEILTANYISEAHSWFKSLEPGQVLDVPMVPMRTLDDYEVSGSVWASGIITLGFRDAPQLTWAPRGDYHFHNRPPHGMVEPRVRKAPHGSGGVMHLQFAHRQRLIDKHVHYMLTERARWPDVRSIGELNTMYHRAVDEIGALAKVPREWWGDYRRDLIDLTGPSWHEKASRSLVAQYGPELLSGLSLWGWNPLC